MNALGLEDHYRDYILCEDRREIGFGELQGAGGRKWWVDMVKIPCTNI